MFNISSLTWTIALTVVAGVAAVPQCASKVHAWAVKVFRLNDRQAAILREVGQWGYVIVVLLFGVLACAAGERERVEANALEARYRQQDEARMADLTSQVRALYRVASHTR